MLRGAIDFYAYCLSNICHVPVCVLGVTTIIKADRNYRPTTNLETITSPCVIFDVFELFINMNPAVGPGRPPSISIYATTHPQPSSRSLFVDRVLPFLLFRAHPAQGNRSLNTINPPIGAPSYQPKFFLPLFVLPVGNAPHMPQPQDESAFMRMPKAFLGALRTPRWRSPHQFHHHIYRIIRSGTLVPRFLLSIHKAYVKAL